LGNENLIGLFGSDIVFFANVCHDLRSREDFDVKFILDGFTCLLKLDGSFVDDRGYWPLE
jgi:hypothetical protein